MPESSYNIRVTFLSRAKQSTVSRFLVLCLVAAFFAGCDRDQIEVYRVAKVASASAPNVPPGWEPAPLGEMRAASFKIKGEGTRVAEVSVVPLPGQAGTDIENVNRWRGQVGASPISEEELRKQVQAVEVAGHSANFFDISGESGRAGIRMLAAILREEGTVWFFKMTGDDELVASQKQAFLGYLKTFQFPGCHTHDHSAGKQIELPPDHPPIGEGRLPTGEKPPAAGPGLAAPREGKPTWTVPAGWRQTEAGQFLVAKFLISGDANAQASVNVSSSPGDGGGLAPNVNRWRGQLGLNSLSEAEVNDLVTSLDAGTDKAKLIDMTGKDARVVAAIVSRGAQTWFYKLMGPTPLVERERDNFIKFVQTTEYPQ
jgi:hypothetical protein